MSNKEHIRDAVIGDVLIINALHNQAIAEGLQEWNKPLPVEHHDDLLSKMLARQYPCVIAEDCIGEVVAYALLSPAYWTKGSCNNFSGSFFCIVSPEHRRKGLGMRLWHALLQHRSTADSDIHRCFANVLSCNVGAVAFLKAIGFISDGELHGVAIKNGQRWDHQYWSRTIGLEPAIEGRNFPIPTDILPVYQPGTRESPVQLRPATLEDVKFLTDIYNHYIFNSISLNFTRAVSFDAREQWLKMLLGLGYPCFVCSHNNQDIGYASLTPYGEDDHGTQCFDDTAYVSAYLVPSFSGKGIGAKLLLALMDHEVVKSGQVKRLIADVIAANSAGVRFAEKCAFAAKVRRQRRLVKFGKWSDVQMFQLNVKTQDTDG